MFTVEMDWDETAITILDDSGQFEDFQIIIYDDIVYMRQWFEEANRYNVIALTPEMLHQFNLSFKLPVGAYMLNNQNGRNT